MRRLVAVLLLVAATAAHAGDASGLFGGRIHFELPDGFAVMPPELAKVKYPGENRPRYIYSNAGTTTSIAVNTANAKLTEAQLPEFLDFIEKTMFRGIPGFKVLRRDVVSLNGVRWARLELTSTAADTDIHNVLLMTALDGQPVIFNFNSTKEEFPSVEAALTKSMRSIRIGSGPATQSAKGGGR